MAHLFSAFIFFSVICVSSGFFEWKNCATQTTHAKVKQVHGCEYKKDVLLSCDIGQSVSVINVFFGHGLGYKSTCDSSWIGQDCGSLDALQRVKGLCEGRRACTVKPSKSVLGDTTCDFGLDGDLFVDYTCEKAPIPEFPRDTFAIDNMVLTPSPLTLPGTVNISAGVTIRRHLPSWTIVRLKIQKKIWNLFWLTIPCIWQYGSCTYENACSLLRPLMFSKCDEEMERRGVECDCPIPTGQFTTPPLSIMVTKQQLSVIPVWDWIVNGKYWVRAEFLDPYQRHLGCMELQVQVDLDSKKK